MSATTQSPEAVGQPATRPSASWAARAIAIILLALFAAQCAWFINTQSLTVDEPSHIISGLNAWRHGEFKEHDDNPPLPRLLFTWAIRGPQWQIEKQNDFWLLAIAPSPEALSRRVRAVNALLGLTLGVLLWFAAHDLFSEGAANFALALFAFSPSLLAHFSLATHDAPAALTTFAAAWQLMRWRRRPDWRQTLLLGAVLGVHLATKHSAVPTFLLAMLGVLLLKPDGIMWRPAAWNWHRAVVTCGVAFVVVWAAYFFHVSKVTLREGRLTATFPNYPAPLEMRAPVKFNATFYLPAGEYLTGLVNVAQNSKRGFTAFLLGERYEGGRRSFFPVVTVLKWPTIVLLLAAAALALWALRRMPWQADLKYMMLFPLLYFAIAMASNMNFGDRHILPVYPFLLLLAAAVWQAARVRRIFAGVLLLAAALNAGDALRYAPGYLSYFNPFVNPAESYRLLSGSNLDWGQGLLALRQYQAEHPEETLHLAYHGSIDPAAYGIRYQRMLEADHPTSTVIVSASNLSGLRPRNQHAYEWLLRYRRKAILNHSLHVFDVPAEAANE